MEEENKKISKKVGVIITVIVILLLIAGIVSWYIISNMDKNTPMFARYESTWVPGSSFKPITGAVGLTTNSFTATDKEKY